MRVESEEDDDEPSEREAARGRRGPEAKASGQRADEGLRPEFQFFRSMSSCLGGRRSMTDQERRDEEEGEEEEESNLTEDSTDERERDRH